MAEFCKKCYQKYGFKDWDKKPLLCEGCGLFFEKFNFLEWFKIKFILFFTKI
jgi:hypothetical protein